MRDPSHLDPSIPLPSRERLIALLNAMRSTGDPAAWLGAFRPRLRDLFDDVDRISIDVNMECALVPREESPIGRRSRNGGRSNGAAKRSTNGATGGEEPTMGGGAASAGERLLERLQWQGDFPVEQYHPPTAIELTSSGSGDHLGVILLWREIAKPPISPGTLGMIELLRPFLTFALSSLLVNVMVRRRFSGISPEGGFAEALDRLFRRKGLSIRERHVLSLLMLGHSYNGIAEELGIAIDTVRKHVRSIHGKTGVHNQLEIFAKYLTFTPLPPVTAEARPGSRDAARRGHAPDARAPRRPTDGGSAERLIAFMNALPMTATSTALLREMHGALHALVDDAWISSTFDMSLDLAATELASQSPRPAVKPQRSGTMLTFSEKGIHVDPETPARGMAARLLDDHRSDGVQMERYHPPILLDYHHAGEEIGGIILWREIGKTPTSRETLDLFEELRPFLTTLFCDLTLRHQYSEPMLAILSNALGELLGREPGSTLTTAEEDVLTLRLMGHSHKSIGEMLGITVNTVKKHGNAINRKMGTSGAADLFARHLAPLIGLDDPFEKSGATLHQHALDGVGVG